VPAAPTVTKSKWQHVQLLLQTDRHVIAEPRAHLFPKAPGTYILKCAGLQAQEMIQSAHADGWGVRTAKGIRKERSSATLRNYAVDTPQNIQVKSGIPKYVVMI
jgi:hypothetical protein